eukprot:CAMPEP_0182424258 /NCGR_PEP_ID=MMETSP1167-20130531/10434_1 /TAXON_ID=2988 /ORGANISM="Mallomonas Sp, Strain CCMP3275" /LENGTH=347 /DNA_ID=CAMNT_0024603919 /DNA_START=239 /DNA_END=1279 /DNA_ORIENTATION=+
MSTVAKKKTGTATPIIKPAANSIPKVKPDEDKKKSSQTPTKMASNSRSKEVVKLPQIGNNSSKKTTPSTTKSSISTSSLTATKKVDNAKTPAVITKGASQEADTSVSPPPPAADPTPPPPSSSSADSPSLAQPPTCSQAISSPVLDNIAPTLSNENIKGSITSSDPSLVVSDPLIKEEPIDPKLLNGKVKLLYQMYDEEFEIVNGSTTAENIDELYCLSFVMPDCKIHLSIYSPEVKRERDIEGEGEREREVYIPEDPPGTYHGLRTDTQYYIYADQDSNQLFLDQQNMKRRMKVQTTDAEKREREIEREDGRGMESCSCIYGNPCVDEYGCKDWDNRYAIAKKNGW